MKIEDFLLVLLGSFLGAAVGIRLTVSWDKKKFEKRINALLREAMYLFDNKDFKDAYLLCEKIFESEIIFDKPYKKNLEQAKLLAGRSLYYLSCEDNDRRKVLRAVNALKIADETNAETNDRESAGYINLYTGLCLWKLSFFKDKQENLHKAVKRFVKASADIPRGHKEFGKLFNNWGTIYRTLAEIEDQSSNCHKALEYFLVAEKFFEEKNALVHLSDVQCNIGNAYLLLSLISNAEENCRTSIQYFKKSLSNISVESCPEMYAVAQIGLSSAISKIPARARLKRINLTKARREILKAIRILSHKDHQDQLASAKINLAIIMQELSRHLVPQQRSDFLRKSVSLFQEGLSTRTIGTHPIEYARIKHNLGNAFYSISKIENETGNLLHAIKSYKESIEIWTRIKYPLPYAMVIHCLSNSYMDLARSTENVKYLHVAISLCFHALRIRTEDKNPWEHCISLLSLCHALVMVAEFYREEKYLREATECIQKAGTIARTHSFIDVTESVESNLENISRTYTGIQNS